MFLHWFRASVDRYACSRYDHHSVDALASTWWTNCFGSRVPLGPSGNMELDTIMYISIGILVLIIVLIIIIMLFRRMY
jgi:hypothetical protein